MKDSQRDQLKDDVNQVLEKINKNDGHSLEDAINRLIEDFYEQSECHHQLNNAIHELAHTKQLSNDDIEDIQNDLVFVMNESEIAATKTIQLVEDLRGKLAEKMNSDIEKILTDILLAQEYQDLAGQRIKKIRKMFEYLEEPVKSLVSCSSEIRQREGIADEVQAYQGDNVHTQQDVDDLMKDLGI